MIPPDSYERERERDWQADFEAPRRSAAYAVIGFIVLIVALVAAMWLLSGDSADTVGDPTPTVATTPAPG